MVKFLDGPAEGQTLLLRRLPKLLRVVRTKRGNWDALDQLDDEPLAGETIWVYQRRDDLEITKYHLLCSPRKGSGFYWNASYQLYAEQPAEHVLRNTSQWQAWATKQLPKPEEIKR